MTISVATPRSGPFSGNGATVAFAFGFLIDDEDELIVVVADANGAETVQTITTHYTVSGVGNDAGGTVTFVTAPSATETVAMRRSTAKDQDLDLQNRGAVVPQLVEDSLDELTKITQDLQEQLDRCIITSLSGNTQGLTFPVPSALTYLRWNSAATALENASLASAATLTLPAPVGDGELPAWDGTGGLTFQRTGMYFSDGGVGDVRLGIGVDPEATLHILDDAPQLRLEDSDLANNEMQMIYDGAQGTIRVDENAVQAGSYFTIYMDGVEKLRLDEGGDLRIGGGGGVQGSFQIYQSSPQFRMTDSDNDAVALLTGSNGSVQIRADDNDDVASSLIQMFIDGTEVSRQNPTGLRIGSGSAANLTLNLDDGDDGVRVPNGTTGERPTAAPGILRWNTTESNLEANDGTDWHLLLPRQGVWTPTLSVSSGSLVHNVQLGDYERIGNLVHIRGEVSVTSVTTPGGSFLTLSGLPFVHEHISGGSYGDYLRGFIGNSYLGGEHPLRWSVGDGNTSGTVQFIDANSEIANFAPGSLSAGDIFTIDGTYRTDAA